MKTLHGLSRSYVWYVLVALLFCLLLSCIVLQTGALSAFAAIHRVAAQVAPPCLKNACDNVDPAGRCDAVSSDGTCLSPYPKDGSYDPTPNSCLQSNSVGGRLALTHPTKANSQLAMADITVDGKPESERLALIQLLYSDTCGTNWLDILPLGRCAPQQGSTTSPCTFTGWIQRSSRNQRDGASTPVFTFPMSPQGTTHSAMVWAPDVGVQGCASATYPDPVAGGTSFPASPFACVTQLGF